MGAGGGAKGEAMRFVAGVLVLFGCGAPTGPVAPVGAIADGGYDAQGAWDAETDGAFPQDAQAAPDAETADAAPDAAPEPDAEVACHPDSCAYGCPCEPGDAIWCDPPDIDMGGGHGAWAVADNGTRRCNPDGRWGDCNASPAHTIDFDWSDYTPCTNEPGDPQCQPTLRANVSACRDPEMPERSCNTDADCLAWGEATAPSGTIISTRCVSTRCTRGVAHCYVTDGVTRCRCAESLECGPGQVCISDTPGGPTRCTEACVGR